MNLTKILTVIGLMLGTALAATATDRVLIIGIEHYRDEKKCNAEMNNLQEGCVTPTYGGVSDALAMEKLAREKFVFPKNSIRILKESEATAANIRDSFKNWIIRDTRPGDRVFVFYSGHGARVKDDGTDESDEKDEILAPFDIQTVPALSNFIRDDEINEWIAALTGRQVVMVFDSCHSGTISRSFGKSGKYLITEEIIKSRSFTDQFSDVPKITRSYDLSTTVDKYMSDKTPNVVVISAAQAYQQAMWFDANGSKCGVDPPNANYRGALAFLFEKIYQNGNPTLSQLDAELKNQMLKLGKAGTGQLCPANNEYQVPVVEYGSNRANATLWNNNSATPNWTQSVSAELQNPLSKIDVRLAFSSLNNSYRIGDNINYTVTVREEVYLYVIVFSEKNIATVIYPYSEDQQKPKSVGTYNFSGNAQEPLGKDVWVVIASRKSLPNLENLPVNKLYSWQEIYDKIGVNKMQTQIQQIARTRGVGVPSGELKDTDWQTTTAVMETLPKR